MQFFKRSAICLFWILTIGSSLPGWPLAVAGPVAGVHYDKTTGMLTVHVQEVPLNEILRKISTASGLKLSIQGDLDRPVTMDLTAVPLDKAIHRLVQPNNLAMIYSTKEDGAVVLTSVKIFDDGRTPSTHSENLPTPGVTDRSNRFYRSNDRAAGSFAPNGREGRMDRGASGRNNRMNRPQPGTDTVVPGSGFRMDPSTEATGSQSTAGAYASDDERRGR